MPTISAVTATLAYVDRRGLVDRIEHATSGVPGDDRVHVHLRPGASGSELRYALEDEGWTVTPQRGAGGTPVALLVVA